MSEEEKEVIEKLKRTIKYSNYCDSIGTGQIEIVLNYINELQNKLASKQKQIKLMQQCDLAKELDKLQKENEELKRKTYKAYINDKGEVQFVFDNYISKDKVRAKIKELEKLKADIHSEHCTYWYKNKIKVLEELLGE